MKSIKDFPTTAMTRVGEMISQGNAYLCMCVYVYMYVHVCVCGCVCVCACVDSPDTGAEIIDIHLHEWQ